MAEQPPGTTSELARMAAGRIGASLRRRIQGPAARASAHAAMGFGASQRWLRAHVGVALALAAVLVLGAGSLLFRRSNAANQSSGDPLSSLALARAANRNNAVPLRHAAAAIEMREFTEALEVLERARAADPGLAAAPEFMSLGIQSFNAGRPARTAALLAISPKDEAIGALQRGTLDWSWRVRHGAADLLKSMGVGLEDPVGVGLLDVWQQEQCDQRRATARRLLALKPGDERLLAGLLAVSRRAADDGCVRELLPPVSAAR